MKKSLVARGFIGAVASLLGVAAVGCSAESGAPEIAEVGSTSQALTVTGTGFESQFPAYIKISSTKMLVVGGYDHTGAGVRTIKTVEYNSAASPNPTATWADLLDNNSAAISLPANKGRGEAEITDLGSNKYLVTGGRDSDGGSALDDAYVITVGSPSSISAAITMANPRVHHQVVACGSKFLVVGGDDDAGFTTAIELFSPGSPGSFSSFQNAGSHDVNLNAAREFHNALPIAANKVIVFGGQDSGGTLLKSTEIINLTNSTDCIMSGTGTSPKPTSSATNDLPVARTKAAAALASVASHEAIMAGGLEGSTAVLTTYLYETSNDTWTSTSAPSLASGDGHIRPMFALDGSGGFALVGGLKGTSSGNNDVTTTKIDVFNGSTFNSSPPSLTTARFGAWTGYLGATPSYVTAQGVTRTFSSGTYTNTWQTGAEHE